MYASKHRHFNTCSLSHAYNVNVSFLCLDVNVAAKLLHERRGISIANALEFRLSCTNPSISSQHAEYAHISPVSSLPVSRLFTEQINIHVRAAARQQYINLGRMGIGAA